MQTKVNKCVTFHIITKEQFSRTCYKY